MNKTIEDGWRMYRRRVLPYALAGLPRECAAHIAEALRHAYYLGCLALHERMGRILAMRSPRRRLAALDETIAELGEYQQHARAAAGLSTEQSWTAAVAVCSDLSTADLPVEQVAPVADAAPVAIRRDPPEPNPAEYYVQLCDPDCQSGGEPDGDLRAINRRIHQAADRIGVEVYDWDQGVPCDECGDPSQVEIEWGWHYVDGAGRHYSTRQWEAWMRRDMARHAAAQIEA